LVVRKCGLRILVQILHVGMRGSAVEVEVIFLYILAMIAFVAGKPKKPFFQDRITFVP